jgi:hypothetical protein
VTLQVSKVRQAKKNKKRKKKKRTEGLVCSMQMCECLCVAAVMNHKETKQLHFLRLLKVSGGLFSNYSVVKVETFFLS